MNSKTRIWFLCLMADYCDLLEVRNYFRVNNTYYLFSVNIKKKKIITKNMAEKWLEELIPGTFSLQPPHVTVCNSVQELLGKINYTRKAGEEFRVVREYEILPTK